MANKRQRIRKARAKREATIALNLSHALPDLPTTTIRTNSKQLARLAERWGTGRPDFVQPMKHEMSRGQLPVHLKTYKRFSNK